MIKVHIPLACILTFATAPQLAAQDYRAQAVRILRTVPLIDGHNAIADAIRERGGLDSVTLAVSQPKLMTDIPRLPGGHVGGQFWAAYVPTTTMDSGPHPAVYALEQIDLIHRLCARNSMDEVDLLKRIDCRMWTGVHRRRRDVRRMAMANTAAAVE